MDEFYPEKNSFTDSIDKFKRIFLRLNREGGKYHPLFNSDCYPGYQRQDSLKIGTFISKCSD